MSIKSFKPLIFGEIVIEELNTFPSVAFVNDGGPYRRKVMSFEEITQQIVRQKDTTPDSPVLITTAVLEKARDLIKAHPSYKAVQEGLLKRTPRKAAAEEPTRKAAAPKSSQKKPQS